MAQISRNTFDDNKNYKKVIEQIGVPVVDNETNEMQNILLTETVENAAVAESSLRSTDNGSSAGLRYCFADSAAWACTGSGSIVDIVVAAGTIFVEGYRITLPSAVSLVANGVTFAGTVGSDIYGWVYCDFVITEVDSTADANIAQSLIGETTRREKLSVTFHTSEDPVGFEAAYNRITALPTITNARIWKNNTGRIFLCKYKRPSGTSLINSSYIVDLRQNLPAQSRQHRKVKTIRGHNTVLAEGAGFSDGMITWDYNNSKLQIGVANGQASDNSLEIGLITSMPGVYAHYIAQDTGVNCVATGAGNTNGTPRSPDGTKGWTISDGQSLGYLAEGTTLNRRSAFLTRKGGNGPFYDYGVTPGSFTPDQLLVEKLVVTSTDSFSSDPGSFILCSRVGADLIWYNGQVTRGIYDKTVFVELGDYPSPWDAVLCPGIQAGGGQVQGTHHIGLVDALERALNYSVSTPLVDGGPINSENGSDGRSIRFWLRRGYYEFVRRTYNYGDLINESQNNQYQADNNTIEFVGDNAQTTYINFRNPEAASRAITSLGVFRLNANTIKFKGLTFAQTHDSTFKGSYVLHLTGVNVILEECEFYGPVLIEANNVIVRNCFFHALGNTYNLFPSSVTGNPIVAQHLLLDDSNLIIGGGVKWEVTHCKFYVDRSDGTHGSVILTMTEDSVASGESLCDIHSNIWTYTSANGKVPAVHVNGKAGHILIHENSFFNAMGVVKAGNVTGDTVPFNGNYNGAPVVKDQGDLQTYALAYISVTKGRQENSFLSVNNNRFDMSAVSNGVSGRFVVWGAMLCVFNALTAGTIVKYQNIRFNDNEVFMGLEFSGWGAAGANPQPWISGFYLAPLWQNGATISDLLVSGIQVCRNKFDLEGTITNEAWRSILAADMSAFPASGGFMTDSSCCIGIQLKNSSVAIGGSTYTGRTGKNIVVDGNQISQRSATGGSAPIYGTVVISDAAHPRWWFIPIMVDSGQAPMISPNIPTEGVSPLPLTAGSLIHSAMVRGNRLEIEMYGQNAVAITLQAAGIYLGGCYETVVANNIVEMDATATNGGMHGIRFGNGCFKSYAIGNLVHATNGIGLGNNLYASGNLIRGATTVFSGGGSPVVTFTGAGTGDNFSGT